MNDWKQKLVDGELGGELVHKAIARVEKSVGEDGGELVTFVISTGQVDRHGDTIDVNGWDLEHYRSNPVVLWQHDPYPGPIGSGKNVRVEDGVLKADVDFSKTHPLGVRAKHLVDEGHLRAVSVGFKIIEWTINEERPGVMPMDITKAELWEFSPVSIPANPGALVENARNAVTDEELELGFRAMREGVETPPNPDISKSIFDLVAEAKAGRVLSQANFDRLASARDEINEVLSAAEPAEDKASKGDGSPVLEIIIPKGETEDE